MINVNFYAYENYVTEKIYQWDIDRVLEITGLNLATVPEIHFANANTERAIVGQAEMENHVIRVKIPNSILQDPLKFDAYVGIYEGSTFKVLEKITVPVVPRKRPADYQITDADEEVYSFKRLENMINNINDEWINATSEMITERVDTWLDDHPEATTTVQDGAITEAKFADDLKFKTLNNYVTPQMFGAVGDGVVDDTEAVQTAIDSATNIYFPSGTYLVSFTASVGDDMNPAITIPSNRKIVLAPDAVISCKGTNLERYAVFRLRDVSNVTIDGGMILGERSSHSGTGGEWGMGISLSYARNVNIRNMSIFDCWGDGICIGTIDNNVEYVCKDIVIDNVVCDNNRRQGISVCGVDGLHINNCKLINTNGTAPQAGIDFESNMAGIPQKRIFINNLHTENNKGYGLLICDKQEMELTVTNWNDIESGTNGYPLHITTQAEYKNGFVHLENVLLKNSPLTAINYSHSANAFPVTIKNLRLENLGINRTDRPGGTFLLFVGNASFNNQCGNLILTGVECNNPSLQHRDHFLFMNTYVDTTDKIDNVIIEIDNIVGLVSYWLKDLSLVTNFKINDKSQKIGLIHEVWGWDTVNTTIRYAVPSASSVDRTFTIGDNMPIGLPFEIINNNPSGKGILLDCALPVLGYLTDNKNKYLKVAPICGAKVIMCRYDANNFYIMDGHEFLSTVSK